MEVCTWHRSGTVPWHRSGTVPVPKRGTEVAAILCTLFETAKLIGVDPRAYITLAAQRAAADHGAVTLPSDLT